MFDTTIENIIKDRVARAQLIGVTLFRKHRRNVKKAMPIKNKRADEGWEHLYVSHSHDGISETKARKMSKRNRLRYCIGKKRGLLHPSLFFLTHEMVESFSALDVSCLLAYEDKGSPGEVLPGEQWLLISTETFPACGMRDQHPWIAIDGSISTSNHSWLVFVQAKACYNRVNHR